MYGDPQKFDLFGENATLDELAQRFISFERGAGVVLEYDHVLALLIAATRFFCGFAPLSLPPLSLPPPIKSPEYFFRTVFGDIHTLPLQGFERAGDVLHDTLRVVGAFEFSVTRRKNEYLNSTPRVEMDALDAPEQPENSGEWGTVTSLLYPMETRQTPPPPVIPYAKRWDFFRAFVIFGEPLPPYPTVRHFDRTEEAPRDSNMGTPNAPPKEEVKPLAFDLSKSAPPPPPVLAQTAPISGLSVLTPSEWALIRPLFLLYVERETALQLEASRGLGMDVFGRASSEIQADIVAYEYDILPKKAFFSPIFTV